MPYQPRVLDAELDDLLTGLPAVAIEGPKGVGKTATASRRAGRVLRLDDPGTREVLAADPEQLRRPGDGPLLIDEWQRLPWVWDAVRRAVDDGARPGSFLLTGSAAPVEVPTHSGAGRIVSLRMRPMALGERGLVTTSVSLRELLTGARPAVEGTCEVDLPTYAEEILASGLPGVRPLSGRARRAQLDAYLTRIAERDFPEQGMRVRRPSTLRAWLTAYAAATSTSASYNSLLDAATAGETEKPAKTTTTAYRDILMQLWLLEPLPGWLPSTSALGRLAQAPKHHLADPALAARLLGLDLQTLLSGVTAAAGPSKAGTLLGALFESLVTMSLRAYAQAAEAEVHHLRTRNGDHEVDLVLERDDGAVLALEVKLSATVADEDVRHLLWLKERLGDRLLDCGVVTTGRTAYRRRDGVFVVPAAMLGP